MKYRSSVALYFRYRYGQLSSLVCKIYERDAEMMDLNSALQEAAEMMGISEETPKTRRKKRAKRAKKVAKKTRTTRRKPGRPAKAVSASAQPGKLPKTKLLSMRFRGDCVDLTFRDLRQLKTPLKFLDKRLARLSPAQLRAGEISKNGKKITWSEQGILVDVAYAMQFKG